MTRRDFFAAGFCTPPQSGHDSNKLFFFILQLSLNIDQRGAPISYSTGYGP